MSLLVRSDALLEATRATFVALGSEGSEAEAVALHLVGSNLTGHDSHGVVRLASYVERLHKGHVIANRVPVTVVDQGALALYDGQNGYGQSVVGACIDHGIDRARLHGVCALGVRNVAHLGRLGHYAEQAAAAGLASIHFVNSTGFAMVVAAFGGTERRLPTNPVAIGFPIAGRQPVIWDIATSAIAEGKVKLAALRGEPVPPATMIDRRGAPTTRAASLAEGGAILPFGGHKGFGLALMCELLAGALTGGGCVAPGAKQMVNNLFSVLINVRVLGDPVATAHEVERLSGWIKSAQPRDPKAVILTPGEIEAQTRAQRIRVGIPFEIADWRQVEAAMKAAGVPATSIPQPETPNLV